MSKKKTTAAPAVQIQTAKALGPCQHCGCKDNLESYKFCIGCGNPLKEQVTPVQRSKTTAEKYLEIARAITINTEEDRAKATEILVQIKNAAELAELEKNKVLIPAEQVVKAEKARWKPIEQLFKEINEIIRPKINKFITDQEAKAQAELAKLQQQVATGHIKKEETIARREEAIYSNVPAKTVYSGGGGSSVRKVAKLKITNPDLVPDEFWVIDEVKLRKAVVTEDREVPGAEKVWENSIAII